MFLIVGNHSDDTNIRIENFDRQCMACGAYGRHRIFERDNKASLFFIPLVTWSKQYFRSCPYCGVTVEIDKDEAY